MKKAKKPVPPQVARAIWEGDTATLRALGRAGGRKSAAIKRQSKFEAELKEDLDALHRELEKELLERELYERAVQANEHTHPVD